MDDDFNTPRALALIFDEVRAINRLLDEGQTSGLSTRYLAVRTMCDVLGLLQHSPEEFFQKRKEQWLQEHQLTHEQVEAWIAQRNRARKEKNWPQADKIRKDLQDRGIVLEDTPGGTVWKIK
jgi:cysteinyl-tRNA synthetase